MRAIVQNIVDRLHVSKSNVDVIRAVRARMKPEVQRSFRHRDARKRAYRIAIDHHLYNCTLFERVHKRV